MIVEISKLRLNEKANSLNTHTYASGSEKPSVDANHGHAHSLQKFQTW